MSLPKNCLYTNKINSSYARNFNSVIQPQNGDAQLGDTIIFNVPTGNNLVMSGADTMLKFDLTIKGRTGGAHAANTIKLNKCGVYGCFQRLRIFHGGTLLSDVDSYANLMDMIFPVQQSSDALAGKYRILAGTDFGGGASVNPAELAADTELPQSYCIPLLSILTWTNNYVPLFAMSGSPLRIELQVVSGINQICKSLNQVVVPTARSLISRIELICNMIELSDTGMNIIKQSIGGGPLQWVCQDYRNYASNVSLGQTVTNVSVPVPAKFNSLNSLFFSFRLHSSGTATFSALESNEFRLQEYFLRIGSRTLPVKPPNTTAEYYSELLRAFGTVSDVNQECSLTLEQYTKDIPVAMTVAEVTPASQTGGFYVGIDLESYSNTSNDTIYSGTNTSTDDIFGVFRFDGQLNSLGTATTHSVRIDSYALFDQLVLIQNGVCTVNY
jgi:hypothetical protein